MKIRNIVLGAAGAVAVCSMGVPRADATVIYDGVGFMTGTQAFTDSFSVSSPGTLTVTLGNVGWPQPLSSLNLLVGSPSGAIGTMNASNSTSLTSTFDVQSGNILAQWYGTAQSSGLDAGVYSLEIQFQPSGSGTNPVPLPTSIGLLLSGLGLLIWQRRTRSTGRLDAIGSHNLSNGDGTQSA